MGVIPADTGMRRSSRTVKRPDKLKDYVFSVMKSKNENEDLKETFSSSLVPK